MIISIIPETPEEKKLIEEQEYSDVTDVFLCGLRKDGTKLKDFHFWRGSYRFLIGELAYYSELVSIEHKAKLEAKMFKEYVEEQQQEEANSAKKVPGMVKYGTKEGIPELKLVEEDKEPKEDKK